MDEYLSGSGVLLDGANSTITTTCAVSSLNTLNTTDLPFYLDVGVRAANIVVSLIILLLGNSLNILTIIVTFRYKELHTVAFVIAAQIAISNFTQGCAIVFPGIINNSIGRWVLGVPICIFCAFICILCSTIRGILFFVFFSDRFAVVFFPFVYPRYSYRIMTAICVLTWSIGLAISLIPIPQLLDCYGFIEAITDCFIMPKCSRSCQIFSYLWILLPGFLCSTIAAGLFAALYIKGRKIRKEESTTLGLSSKTISDSDWRALKTISILFGAFIMTSFLPTALWFVFDQLHGITALLMKSALNLLYNLALVADPIIILRNADTRSACRKLQSDIKEAWSRSCKRIRGDS